MRRPYDYQSMSDIAKVDLLIEQGHIDEAAAKMLVEMFSGKSSPEMREIIDAVHGELTRTDLATKVDLKAALEPHITKTDLELAITNQKLELLDRIGKVEGNLRGWVIGVGALAATLANIDKLLALFGSS